MKNSLINATKGIGSIAFILLGITCQAQKLNVNQVPSPVKSAMEKKFPGITKVNWGKEEKDYEAEFSKDGKEMSAIFNASGTWIETETAIAVSELPQPIKTYVAQNMKGKKITEAAVIHRSDGSTVYEAETNNTDYVFDATGKLLKTEKEGKEEREK